MILLDKLSICRVAGFEAPIGTPVTFQGNEIGHVVMSREEGYCAVAINSDMVHTLLRSGNAKISLEVSRK